MKCATLGICLLLGAVTTGIEVSGTLAMPEEWTVFPVVDVIDRDNPDFKTLKSIPDSIKVSGETVTGKKVKVRGNSRDLKDVFGHVQMGNTAYVFIPLNSKTEQTVTLGLGADWWLQAWVNGKEIINTLETGNIDWPPDITNFTRNVPLDKGANILTVKFISGTGSSVLAVGGPDELRMIPPEKWRTMDFNPDSRLCYAPRLQENRSQAGPGELGGAGIVIRRDAAVGETTAAHELAGYLEKATGKKSEIIHEDTVSRESGLIYVGSTQYAMKCGIDAGSFDPEQWLIRSIGGNLIITGGNPRGVLYAVYHFLEKTVGVRWWSPWEEYVPDRSNGLPAGEIDLSGTPLFKLRCLNTYNLYDTKQGQEKLWAPRNRINTEMHVGIPYQYGGGIEYGPPSFVHTEGQYYNLLRNRGLLKPEWVAMKNGKREILTKAHHFEYQLCLSNAELRKAVLMIMLENIRKTRASEVPPVIFDFSFNDTSTKCECPSCAETVKKYGSDAGLILEFVNELAARIEEKYPEVMLQTMAYMNTEPVPEGIVPRDNVMVVLCDTLSSYTVPIPEDGRFGKLLAAWSRIAGKIKIWDYHTTFGDTALPMPFELVFQPDLQLFHKHHAYGVMTEYHFPVFEDMRDLRFWVLAKLLEDPYQDTAKLIEDFTEGFYGNGGRFVREYLILLQDAARKTPGNFTTQATLEVAGFITPEFVVKAQKCFDEAEKAVADSEILSRRIRLARLGADKAAFLLFPKISAEYPSIHFNRDSLLKRINRTVDEQYALRAGNLLPHREIRAKNDRDRFMSTLKNEIQMDSCDDINKFTWNQPAWRPKWFTKEEVGKLEVSTEHKVTGKGSIHWSAGEAEIKAKLLEMPNLRFIRLTYLYGTNIARATKIKFHIKCENAQHPPIFATLTSPSGKYKHIPVLARNEVTGGWKEIIWELGDEAGQNCTHLYFRLFALPEDFRAGDGIDIYLDDIRMEQ